MARKMVECSMALQSAIVIRHIFISPGHNFFGRHGQPAGTNPAVDVASVSCRAGRGLEGDRFFSYRPDYNGQVTFFSWEVYEDAKREFRVPHLAADAFRRNVIVEGVHLNELIGSAFTLDGVEFQGVCEARPCHWMNTVVADGAEQWLRGRGGLRAKILSDGELHRGPVQLVSPGLLALG